MKKRQLSSYFLGESQQVDSCGQASWKPRSSKTMSWEQVYHIASQRVSSVTNLQAVSCELTSLRFTSPGTYEL